MIKDNHKLLKEIAKKNQKSIQLIAKQNKKLKLRNQYNNKRKHMSPKEESPLTRISKAKLKKESTLMNKQAGYLKRLAILLMRRNTELNKFITNK